MYIADTLKKVKCTSVSWLLLEHGQFESILPGLRSLYWTPLLAKLITPTWSQSILTFSIQNWAPDHSGTSMLNMTEFCEDSFLWLTDMDPNLKSDKPPSQRVFTSLCHSVHHLIQKALCLKSVVPSSSINHLLKGTCGQIHVVFNPWTSQGMKNVLTA